MDRNVDRRTFAKGTALRGLAALAAPAFASRNPNERIRLGFIGVGNRGDQLLDAFLVLPDAEVVALCDVYQPYLEAAQRKVGGRASTFTDFRKLLDLKDIDAVVIATPDHWHALQFVYACRAGKDVYVEKPLSLTIAEGRKMVSVAKETARVTQVGLHRRSAPFIRQATELIRNGAIGKVTVAKCYHLVNEFPMGIGHPSNCEPPARLDWDMWLGPAPKVPFNPNRCLYKFRWFNDYSGGQLTNMGAHYLDVIHWALNQDAPQAVVAVGGKFAVHDNRDIPDTMEVVWQYPETLVTMSQFNANHSPANPRGCDLEFRGTKGVVFVDSNGFEIVAEPVRTRELPALSPLFRKENAELARASKKVIAPLSVRGRCDTADHARNFLDCVRSRKAANCPVEVGHRSTSATLLGKIALQVGQFLTWDANAERFTNSEQANRLLSYDYRLPWRLAP
jgi:predicted dehydrogenase